MKNVKKLIMIVLSIALVISSLYIGELKAVSAASTFVIRVGNTNNYLYEKNGNQIRMLLFSSQRFPLTSWSHSLNIFKFSFLKDTKYSQNSPTI